VVPPSDGAAVRHLLAVERRPNGAVERRVAAWEGVGGYVAATGRSLWRTVTDLRREADELNHNVVRHTISIVLTNRLWTCLLALLTTTPFLPLSL
jgi:hypothetical protein